MKFSFFIIGAACAAAVAQTALEDSKAYPVSFVYDGAEFAAEAWSPVEQAPGTLSYTSPDGKLKLNVEYRHFPGYPVTEIIPVLECAGNEETAIIENICSLKLRRPCDKRQIRVRRMPPALQADSLPTELPGKPQPTCNLQLH